jgi:hypothetical protein
MAMASAANSSGRALPDDRSLFVLATVLVALGSCVGIAAFNNYLKDRFALDVAQRTFLEMPREMPGFLVSLFVGALAALGSVRIAAVANLAASAGMLALGWIPASFVLMLGSVFVLSSGQHVYLPLANAMGMGFAAEGREGSVLGKFQAAATTALVAGSALLLLLFRFARLSYAAAFTAGSVFYLGAALALLAMRPRRSGRAPRRFVVRREYGRFYLLSVLYGARKQLFITFGPWMLVDSFGQGVSTMTLLFLAASVIGIGALPLVGRLTDRFGARAVLGGEALLTIAVCIAYAFAPELLPRGAALGVVVACYVIDQSANAVTMTRAVYAKRLMRSPEDLAPTLSLGISIDHFASMIIPMLGALAWQGGDKSGYRWVFLGGALVAALNFAVTRGIGGNASAEPLGESRR